MKWLDHVLLFCWGCLAVLLVTTGLLTVFPTLQTLLSYDQLVQAGAYGFLFLSNLRFLHNMQPEQSGLLVMAVGYVLVVGILHALVYSGLLRSPPHLYAAALVFDCVVCFFVPGAAYLWERIKPEPRPSRVRRIPK